MTVQTIDVGDLADVAEQLVTGLPLVPAGPYVVSLASLDLADVCRLAALLAARPIPLLVGYSPEPVPAEAAPLLELFACTIAPSGPGRSWVAAGADALAEIQATVQRAPVAAATLARVLAAGDGHDVDDALELESLAYSLLLASEEFWAWRRSTPAGVEVAGDTPVLVAREGDVLVVELNRPDRHNAFGRAIRDELLAALAVAQADPTISEVRLRGRGPSFCSGGDLNEFGTANSPILAHLLRLQQSAGLAVHLMADRVVPELHGACIGAGIEIPAFADHVVAHADVRIRLPEVSMGLIPGAGGTVSLPRRIGRWRTAFMALTGRTVDLATALEWGLVDAEA